MKFRMPVALAVTALVIALASACTPEPAPSPTPTTAFATEDEAFAAAEATYRAYVDALNAVEISDPASFDSVLAWTTGDANGEERKTLSQMHADNWVVAGETEIVSFVGTDVSPGDAASTVTAAACSDVSDVSVVDSAGVSQVSVDRPDRYSLQITFVSTSATSTGLQISDSKAVTDGQCDF